MMEVEGMMQMLAMNATDVRKEWSSVCDSVIREKPAFIKRTRDFMMLSDLSVIEAFLEPYRFHAVRFVESDGSITLSLDEIDLVENGADDDDAVKKLAEGILEYADIYFERFASWSLNKNRKAHIPYIFKALILGDAKKIGGLISCHPGET
jgi:hypothetical protein